MTPNQRVLARIILLKISINPLIKKKLVTATTFKLQGDETDSTETSKPKKVKEQT